MSKKAIPKDIDMVKPMHGLLAVRQFAVKKMLISVRLG